MKQRGGGGILHNPWICAVQPLWYEPIYNTTKSALMMFSKCLATELVGDNIRVNCILPGWVMTERQRALWVDAAGERPAGAVLASASVRTTRASPARWI